MTAADPALPSRLDGRRALVTGASQGIGADIAVALAAAGADEVLSGRPTSGTPCCSSPLRPPT